MFIDESLRSHEHPGIVFRPGPTGRRAALSGGPDVWEIIAALHAIRDEDPGLHGDDLIDELTEMTGLDRQRVTIALRYYATYPGEVDERIAINREVTEREEQLWTAQHDLLRRRT